MPEIGCIEMLSNFMANSIIVTNQQTIPPKDSTVILSETNGVEYSIEIKKIPTKFILIKPENLDFLIKNISGMKGEKQISDYILISESTNGNWIIYIELKKGGRTCTNIKIREQLIGSKCSMEYCKWLVKFFWEGDSHFEGYQERYVCLNTLKQRLNKKPTRPPHHQLHDTPDKFLSLDGGEGIFFMRLIEQSR